MGHLKQFHASDTSRVVSEVTSMRLDLTSCKQGMAAAKEACQGQVVDVVDIAKGSMTASLKLTEAVSGAVGTLVDAGADTVRFRMETKTALVRLEGQLTVLSEGLGVIQTAQTGFGEALGRMETQIASLLKPQIVPQGGGLGQDPMLGQFRPTRSPDEIVCIVLE